MTARRKLSLLLALSAFAAPGFAAEITQVYTPPLTYYYYTPTITEVYTPTITEVYTPTITEVYTPIVTEVYAAPPVTVIAPRLTEDQLINNEVIDVLVHDPYLSGKIGVETYRNSVELTGVVTTPGQARRAERDALSVDGVREVRNDLRTRVGGRY